MDKLQHIDQLLRSAAQEPANAFVFDADWEVIEKKLGRRKSRTFALWFFLALISISVSISILYTNSYNSDATNTLSNTKTKPANDFAITDKTDVILEQGDANRNDEKNAATSRSSISTEKNHAVSSVNLSSEQPLTNLPFYSADNAPDIIIQSPDKQIYITQEAFSKPNILNSAPLEVALFDWVISQWLPIDHLDLPKVNNTSIKKSSILQSHWEVGPAFTPSLSGRFFSQNKNNPNLINPFYQSLVANSERITFSNSYGINAQFHPASNFYIATGLFLTQRGEKIDYNYLITNFANEVNGVVANYSPSNPLAYEKVTYSGSNSYHFIEIPINVGYKYAISANFELRSQIGLSYMALNQRQGKKGDPISLQLNDLKDLNLRTQNMAANVKTGLFYNAKQLAIGVEPMFGMNINTLDQNTALIKTKPYSFGLNLSTNFKIYKK